MVSEKRVALRQVAVALLGLLLSFAIVSGMGRPHGRYFYCEAMGLLATDPCTAGALSPIDQDVGPAPAVRQSHGDCCELVIVPSMQESTLGAAQAVPPPPFAATLPAAPTRCGLTTTSRGRPDRSFERWRLPPPYPGELRARLSVFLT